jgi:hypothetical protein
MLSQDVDRATALINTENIKKFFNKSYNLEQLCSVQLLYQSGTRTHAHAHTHTRIHTCTFTLHTVFTVPKQVHNFAPRENSMWLKTVHCIACWQHWCEHIKTHNGLWAVNTSLQNYTASHPRKLWSTSSFENNKAMSPHTQIGVMNFAVFLQLYCTCKPVSVHINM